MSIQYLISAQNIPKKSLNFQQKLKLYFPIILKNTKFNKKNLISYQKNFLIWLLFNQLINFLSSSFSTIIENKRANLLKSNQRICQQISITLKKCNKYL